MKGMYDPDELLLHANFQILVDFIDKENPGDTIDWSCDNEHKAIWKEIVALYKWWTEERIEREKLDPLNNKDVKKPDLTNVDNFLNYDREEYKEFEEACQESAELELAWYKEDTENLLRLIKIREWLWT